MHRSISELTAAAAVIAVALVGAACVLPSPDYDGTQFACDEPPNECPEGFSCIDGVCRDDDEISDLDPPDAGPGGTPDAAVGDPAPDADADATGGGGDPITLTFGERPDANVSGVTTDTYLEEDFPDDVNGASERVAVDADPVKVGLLRFDLSAIPDTATILEASLEVTIDDPIEFGTFELHVLLESWDEPTASWNRRAQGVPWTTPGAGSGSVVPVPVGETAPRDLGVVVVDLEPSLVALWLSDDDNHGMRWIAVSAAGRGGEFLSREEEEPEKRPLLRVTYQN